MRVVIALGEKSLEPQGRALDVEAQRERVRVAARAVASVARHHDVVITHGSGLKLARPGLTGSVGLDPSAPLDWLEAGDEGALGYLIEQELQNLLPDRDIATLLTQVEVSEDDPAFAAPSAPVGPVVDAATAGRLERERGWSFGPASGGLRRRVPAPAPQRVREIRTISLLVNLGVIVVCGGGGGIPVVRSAAGGLRGVEAVIDPDLSAVMLATQVGADRLLLLTDVAALYADWPSRHAAVRSASPRSLRDLELDAATIGPKVEAACRFAKQARRPAAIGAIEDASRLLTGEAGTSVVPGNGPLRVISL